MGMKEVWSRLDNCTHEDCIALFTEVENSGRGRAWKVEHADAEIVVVTATCDLGHENTMLRERENR